MFLWKPCMWLQYINRRIARSHKLIALSYVLFQHMTNEEEANAAIAAMNDCQFEGSNLRVERASQGRSNGRGGRDAVSIIIVQATSLNRFSWIKTCVSWFQIHWTKQTATVWTIDRWVYWRIYSGREAWTIFFNTLWPSDAIWWHRSAPALDQVMACCDIDLGQQWLG